MELKDIQSLIKFVAKSGVSEVDVEVNGVKVRIKADGTGRVPEPTNNTTTIMQPMSVMPSSVPVAANPVTHVTHINEPATTTATDDSNYVTVKSPMIGTFYLKPSPDKPTFVNVGDSVSVGDTICIIEAMKLFNEVESEVTGKIVKILVDDSTPVEFDQPLFLVDPS